MPRDESPLLRIPLVAQMLEDPRVELCGRAVDNGWKYHECFAESLGGFHPTSGKLFYPVRSALGAWLQDKSADVRELNVSDRLVNELLFLTHDYLHAWGVLTINELYPQLGFGWQPITEENFEAMVFAMLATEAVATVGLDYWYLSTIDLERLLGVGTGVTTLTVSYHDRDAAEFRRFSPTFDVQSPEFYGQIARFYCSGTFAGFDLADARRSPKLLSWLRHELSYGVNQRVYSRQWIGHLADEGRVSGLGADRRSRGRPVAADAAWQVELIEEIGRRLWRKVKQGQDAPATTGASSFPNPDEGWRSVPRALPDYRFVNLLHRPLDGAALAGMSEQPRSSRKFAALQHVSQFDYEALPSATRRVVRALLENHNVPALVDALAGAPRVEPDSEEPMDIFLLN